MKAFIFNSGSGTRLRDLTSTNPKALVRMKTGETILGRQIRILRNAGIKDFVISTGPFHEQIEKFVEQYEDLNFTLIQSDKYTSTNSIYSMYISGSAFDDDFIILHGDLVFDEKMVKDILASKENNLVLINKSIPKPPKDFKGRVDGEYLREISVNIFDEDCFALQPFYKVSKDVIRMWLHEIDAFIKREDCKIYAENALNLILHHDLIKVFNYDAYYVDEIDNLEDYERVSKGISQFDYINQEIVSTDDYSSVITSYLKKHDLKRPLLIHGRHITSDPHFIALVETLQATHFTSFSPNPKYEEIIEGHRLLKQDKNDVIIALGGGSAIDVAKAIKLYSPYEVGEDLIHKPSVYVDLKLIAIPTTAGTGSESTRYSVMYYKGEKQSLTNDSLLPDLAILSPSLLKALPIYQRKATLLDALSQAIEGYWAYQSTPVAQAYARDAIKLILKHYEGYIHGDNTYLNEIMFASNLAGRAINISATTAPHAMSYMITSLKGVAHGHAVALTLPFVFEVMVNELDDLDSKLSKEEIRIRFTSLANVFGLKDYKELVPVLHEVYASFDMERPFITSSELQTLVSSVNPERLGNNPLIFTTATLEKIYRLALSIKD